MRICTKPTFLSYQQPHKNMMYIWIIYRVYQRTYILLAFRTALLPSLTVALVEILQDYVVNKRYPVSQKFQFSLFSLTLPQLSQCALSSQHLDVLSRHSLPWSYRYRTVWRDTTSGDIRPAARQNIHFCDKRLRLFGWNKRSNIEGSFGHSKC